MSVCVRLRSAPRLLPSAGVALSLATLLGGLGCGENVLVGSWELRLSTDAGLFDFPPDAGADAAPNSPSSAAQSARENMQKKADAKPQGHRPNNEKGH